MAFFFVALVIYSVRDVISPVWQNLISAKRIDNCSRVDRIQAMKGVVQMISTDTGAGCLVECILFKQPQYNKCNLKRFYHLVMEIECNCSS